MRLFQKCIITLDVFRQTGEPYDMHRLKFINRHLTNSIPDLGNCNWGTLQFICFANQYYGLIEDLRANGHSDYADTIEVDQIKAWPRYPINATGEDLTGPYDQTAVPRRMQEILHENAKLRALLGRLKKSIDTALEPRT